MIRIAVVSRQGVPVAGASADFGPQGGTVGRADTNTLVLSDPERTVSRVHAQVLCRDGQYVIVDRGSNPMQSNGQPLGSGREAPLADGDRLVVGGFELLVSAAAPQAHAAPAAAAAAPAAGDDDPFADLLAGLAPPPPAAAPPAPAPADLPFPDPLAAGTRQAAADAPDPFADLMAPPAAPAPAGGPVLDDFSDLGLPAAASPTASAQKIDELFGGMGSGLGGDPLALSPLADPLLQPNTAGAVDDPLAALQQARPPAQAPRSDHLPIGQFGFEPPRAAMPAAPAPATPPDEGTLFDDQTGQPIRISRRAAPAPAPAVLPDDPLTGIFAAPAAPQAAPVRPAAAPEPAPSPPPAPVRHAAPAAAPVAAASAAPAVGSADAGDLLAAFLRGLGPMHQPPTTLTPALMERIGVLLRGATEGTLQLLLTRQEFKREVRAEVTMIAAQANNPLKFSPTVDVALTHLLGPGVRGFMPAEAAMRDAFDDLRSHQFGVMVGMRAALARLIERFGPEELEKKIAAKSALDSLFAANRKAKLWDQFTALYAGIASEAEDDFHALFGKAFLEAYEEQMARLKDGDRA